MLGFFIVGCGQNQESPKYAGEGDSVIDQAPYDLNDVVIKESN